VVHNDDPLHPDTGAMATMRALNPALILLASSSAAELDFSPTNTRTFDAQRIGSIPTSWLLLQVGSTLSAPVTSASALNISVADTSKFRVNDLVVVDDEKCLVTAVGSTLTVKRGFAGSTAATHAGGTRIAAVVSGWSYAATLDMTAACPLGRATGAFATPGTGTERAADWLARRTAGIAAAADWDGVMVDVCIGTYANSFRGDTAFRTIANRAAPATEADYTAFDLAWQAGIEAYLARVRALAGNKLVMTNGAPPVFDSTNGTCFEGFPTAETTALQWHSTVVGPTTDSRGGSYLDWSAKAPTPNLTTMFTMGAQNDYRLMRFGLSTALMGDGYYSFKTPVPGQDFSSYWYDEYDNAGAGRGYLGAPTGAMYSQAPQLTSPDLLGGYGGFADQTALNAWVLYPRTNYAATKAIDNATAKVTVTQSEGTIWGVQLSRSNIPVSAGKTYTLTFRARADRPLAIRAVLQQAANPYSVHAVTDEIGLSTDWQTFELPLTSASTDSATNMIFNLGASVGTIWIDDVKLQEGDRNVYRRDYEGGIALVNATAAPVTVQLNGTFRKIKGTQAPLVNDGNLVTAVTLPAKDGLVLLRTAPAPATAPVAHPDSYTTANATMLTVPAPGLLGNDTDAEGDALTGSIVTQPTNGTLSLGASGSFTYTPTPGFAGVDSFTYRAYDGTAYSAPATVSITVAAADVPAPVVLHAPVAKPDSYATNAGTVLRIAAAGVLANDTDSQGHALTASLVVQPTRGTLSFVGDGSFVYAPAAGFAGIDSFTYRASDGTAESAAMTVSIVVVAPAPATPTVVYKPVVKRRGKSSSRTYSLSGSVRLGSPAEAPVMLASSGSAAAQAATPVLLEVRIERYVKKHWRVYKRIRVVNPGSRYSTRAKLRSGTYRARALVTGGNVPAGRSTTTKSFKVR
jgi:hypothetical protein